MTQKCLSVSIADLTLFAGPDKNSREPISNFPSVQHERRLHHTSPTTDSKHLTFCHCMLKEYWARKVDILSGRSAHILDRRSFEPSPPHLSCFKQNLKEVHEITTVEQLHFFPPRIDGVFRKFPSIFDSFSKHSEIFHEHLNNQKNF